MNKVSTKLSSKDRNYGSLVVTLHDRYGNLKQKIEQPVDSYNRQLWRALQRNLSNLGNGTLTRIDNTTGTDLASVFAFGADSGVDSYGGIIVGSGTNPTGINTVTMQSLIDLGTGSGQLVGLNATTEYDQSTCVSTITRSFISLNADSGTISVNEVGIAGSRIISAAKTSAYLMVRDVLNTTINVNFEETITVQYKVRVFNGNNNYSNIVIKPFSITGTPPSSSTLSLTNTNNITITTLNDIYKPTLLASAGDSTYGIVFGTSNTTPTRSQVNLQSAIVSGNSAGQLFYHEVSNTTIFENTTTNSLNFYFTRAVENRSGSNVSISEIALIILGPSVSRFMLDRRVIDPPVTVTNGNIVAFTWEFCYEV